MRSGFRVSRPGFHLSRALLIVLTVLPVAGGAGSGSAAPATRSSAQTRSSAPARAFRDSLSDGTVVESWTLANGLRVITREVPGARSVAISLGYRFGIDDDPEGLEGLASLLSEVFFPSAAGAMQERAIAEVDSLRPEGWSRSTLRRSTLLTEVVPVEESETVLEQAAARLGGVKVSASGLRASIKRTQSDMASQTFGEARTALAFRLRELAAGHGDEALLRRSTARGLDALRATEAEEWLHRVATPRNSVLSVVGGFSPAETRASIDRLLGPLPQGPARPTAERGTVRAAKRTSIFAGLGQPIGMVGVLAPALSDSSHPSFVLAALLLGRYLDQRSPSTDPASRSRFSYAVLDEPELARFELPVKGDARDTDPLATEFGYLVQEFRALIVERSTSDLINETMSWSLGGPMSAERVEGMRTDPNPLHTLARGQAARLLSADYAFWRDYSRRFQATALGGIGRWSAYFQDPSRQVLLLLVPRR